MAAATKCPSEFVSVEEFVAFLLDDERESFTTKELHELSYWHRRSWRELLAELQSYGLALQGQGHERAMRMASDNPHDRWYGPGSSPSHGGSGWEQIAGMAGRVG